MQNRDDLDNSKSPHTTSPQRNPGACTVGSLVVHTPVVHTQSKFGLHAYIPRGASSI